MQTELIARLRADLRAAGYLHDEVSRLLGEPAEAARLRGVFAPARRVLDKLESTPLNTLIRCCLLGDVLPAAMLDAALPTLGASGLVDLGLAEARAAGLRAILSLNPVEVIDSRTEHPLHWWIISDLDDQLRQGPARPDHVMGVGGATRSLIAQLPPGDAARTLDLGTGCGIVALHLALRGSVVATDINPRALELARMNLALNGAEDRVDLRLGDLFAPVSGERFDLIASNPPFVVTPRGSADPQFVYRDGGLVGDELAREVVRQAPALLNDDGTLLCLANWETPWGGRGLERVHSWIADAAETVGALHGWVIERDVLDPALYAETWVRDGGVRAGTAEFDRLMTQWLEDFTERGIVSIGLGAVRVRRAGDDPRQSVIRVEHAAGAYTERPGASLEAALAAGVTASRFDEDAMLAAHWVRDDTVIEVREHRPGEEAPRSITIRTARPLVRTVTADPLLAAAIGACDGELSLGSIADALATILDLENAAVAEALVAGVRELSWLGILAPAQQ